MHFLKKNMWLLTVSMLTLSFYFLHGMYGADSHPEWTYYMSMSICSLLTGKLCFLSWLRNNETKPDRV